MQNVNRKSGPHPSLRSHSGEVREEQPNLLVSTESSEERTFLIERLCPKMAEQQYKKNPQLRDLQFPILVKVAAAEPNHSHPCSARLVYRVNERRAAQIRKHSSITGAGQRYVCEHMGRLIE